tara:strand:+ start:69 stop:509 length:441 start_codon:yes stop_codon:yes gene_type:complete
MTDKKIKQSVFRNAKLDDVSKHLRDKIFGTYAKVLTFAAYCGIHNNLSEPLASKNRISDPIKKIIFDNENLLEHIYAIAFIANNKDASVLKNEGLCFELFENYANGGLKYVNDLLQDNPRDTDGVETIMTLVKEINSENIEDIYSK